VVTTVACVLKAGPEFDSGHVARLAYQVREHSPAGTKFICLTDDERTLDADFGVPLKHGWARWWSKIEVLSLPGPALYCDLDVSVIGDLTPLLDAATEYDFVALADFWLDGPHRLNSSVMAWRGDMSSIYRAFLASPEDFMSLYSSKALWGDQRFIADTYKGEPTIWQTILPGKVVSFKRGALMGEDLSDCRIVCSHGRPRPWDHDGCDKWLARRAKSCAT
jgi:hypothetical protein